MKTQKKTAVPTQPQQFLNVLNATGLTVVAMTKTDMADQIPGHIKDVKPLSYMDAYELAPLYDEKTRPKRQIVMIYDENLVDANGQVTGKTMVCIKLLDKVCNLTTMDAAQIKIGTSYVTRMNYRLDKDEHTVELFSKNVMENILGFRKLIDDPTIVRV